MLLKFSHFLFVGSLLHPVGLRIKANRVLKAAAILAFERATKRGGTNGNRQTASWGPDQRRRGGMRRLGGGRRATIVAVESSASSIRALGHEGREEQADEIRRIRIALDEMGRKMDALLALQVGK